MENAVVGVLSRSRCLSNVPDTCVVRIQRTTDPETMIFQQVEIIHDWLPMNGYGKNFCIGTLHNEIKGYNADMVYCTPDFFLADEI